MGINGILQVTLLIRRTYLKPFVRVVQLQRPQIAYPDFGRSLLQHFSNDQTGSPLMAPLEDPERRLEEPLQADIALSVQARFIAADHSSMVLHPVDQVTQAQV